MRAAQAAGLSSTLQCTYSVPGGGGGKVPGVGAVAAPASIGGSKLWMKLPTLLAHGLRSTSTATSRVANMAIRISSPPEKPQPRARGMRGTGSSGSGVLTPSF
jgi:hypothetical protein